MLENAMKSAKTPENTVENVDREFNSLVRMLMLD